MLLTRTADEWEALLNAAGVPAARIHTVAEVLAHPQVTQRGLLHRFDSVPGADAAITVQLPPFKFAHDGPQATTPPPPLGAHTDLVLSDLGYSAEEIQQLRRERVI